ncbi:MAG: ATP-binding protein [Candidatus Aminicenantales bacterium]
MKVQAHEETNYRKLTSRNTLLTILLFVSPFLLLYLAVNYEVSSLIKRQIYDRLAATVAENIKTITVFLQDRETDLKSFSHFDIDGPEDVPRLTPVLASRLAAMKWYDFILVTNLEGRIILSLNTDLSGTIADREYFRASRAGRFFNSGIFFSEIVGSSVMILSVPLINRNDKIVGVVAAGLDLPSYYGLLFDLRIGETSELFLTDDRGIFLSPTKLGGRPLIDKGFLEKEGNPHEGLKGVKTHTDYRGQRVLCAYAKIPGSTDYLVSEIDLKEALLPLRQVNRIILYLFLPFFVLLVFISTLNSRRTTSLLRRLTTDLRRALEEARGKKKEVDVMNIELQRRAKESELLAEELRLSEEYITNLVDSIFLGVVGLDSSGRITHFNKEIRQLFNLPELKKGENIFQTLPWLNDKDIELAFDKTILSGRPNRIDKKRIDRRRGEEFFNLSFFPVEDARGQIVGVSILIEDVTEREKLHHQLADYEKLSALSQLALGAAHEINNPLLGISSYLEILRDETSGAAKKQEIEVVLENVYRISETIRGLLNFARPTPPQFTKININQLVEDTLSFLGHQPIFRNVRIEKVLPAGLPQVTADLNQIRQVLTNIFINAAQSMSGGGELNAETSKVKFQDRIQIQISDTGIGIPPENLKKIFDPFFTTKKSQGTGLGLSISLRYIKNHDGEISVRSEAGKGATFSILLPIRQKGRVSLKDEEVIS